MESGCNIMNLCKVKSMDDSCRGWVESMGVARVVVSRRQV